MRRREFISISALALAAPVLTTRAADEKSTARQFFELGTYHFPTPEKQAAFEKFLDAAAIPAFNRAGVEPVGAFKPLAKDNPQLKLTADPLDCYVFLPHNSLDS